MVRRVSDLPQSTEHVSAEMQERTHKTRRVENTETAQHDRLLQEVHRIATAMQQGELNERADFHLFQGEERILVEQINHMLDAVIQPLRISADYVARIASGDIPPAICDAYRGDFNEIKNNLNTCIESLNGLIDEMNRVSGEHIKGDIDAVIDVDRFHGAYRTMATGVNEMVGGHIAVKKKAMACIAAFGNGDFEAPLETFPGKKAFINHTIEQVRTNLKALIVDTDALVQSAAKGDLSARADVSNQPGDFRKIVVGINTILELISEPLKVTERNASALAAAAEQLTAVSQQMAGNAEETATQASIVSSASDRVSQNVASVATSSEQMQASIREIAKNANEAARVARNAVNVAESANAIVMKLEGSSQEIGKVIKVITSIAQQTNLLALNATIEAARAGESGKGFAVVANEVKELAKQTARATEDIGVKIEAIQNDSTGAIKAIESIGGIIDQVNGISSTIASAVEEQTVTTNEIGRSVGDAARGVGEIASNIAGVATAARDTTRGATDTQNAARALSEMASQLQQTIARFTL